MVGGDHGHLRFSLRSVEALIRAAIAQVPGTKSIDAKLAGIGGRAYPRLLVQIDPERELVSVDANIAATWPSPVTEVAVAARGAIEAAVREYMGYFTSRVNITVGALEPGPRVSEDDIAKRGHPSGTHPQELSAHEPRHILAPHPKALRPTLAPRPDRTLREVSTPKHVTAPPIAVPAPVILRATQAPAPLDLKEIASPAPQPLRSIAPPRVDVETSPVLTPPPMSLRPVSVPRAVRLRRVYIDPVPRHTAHVYAPLPELLRAITINPRWKAGTPLV
ncbi:hypothetical protein [Corynebacterium flavescens]|uniref:hypothetical protein n=1 Tax=Corynebacterium flavescens TaxID=28028 RepID=UPI0026491C64|nr:hypothetical protein [Corynebacterium flavescens]MDN6430330.1 hypothetical protein [Corynebacterium flavescens]MDN6823653.1 hypothetical protein [Corynebacterium flavescens]